MIKGIDVSKWQKPESTPYALLSRNGYSFVIARACYGITPDATFDDHVLRARSNGMTAGGYLFWRHDQDPEAQARAFRDTVAPLNYSDGWIIPALDLEWQSTSGKATAASMAPALRTAELLREWFGNCLIYTAASFWIEVGRPGWWLDYPSWIAHYGVPEKDVKTLSGKSWTIWQHASSPIDGLYAANIDQNLARELPLVTRTTKPDDVGEQFIPASGASDQPGSEAGVGGAGGASPGGGSLVRGTEAGESDPGNDHAADQEPQQESGLAEMSIGDRVADKALELLTPGPWDYKLRRAEHVAFLDRTFGKGAALLDGIHSGPGTECAVFVGGVMIDAGFPRRGHPKIPAITTWIGASWFNEKLDWIPLHKLESGAEKLRRGDVPYWCGKPGQSRDMWLAAYNGHVEILLEGDGWMWRTAGGGGGADGTLCKLGEVKDIRLSHNRPLRGVWRPSRMMGAPAEKAKTGTTEEAKISPQADPKPVPIRPQTDFATFIKDWQRAIGVDPDGKFGKDTWTASMAILNRSA